MPKPDNTSSLGHDARLKVREICYLVPLMSKPDYTSILPHDGRLSVRSVVCLVRFMRKPDYTSILPALGMMRVLKHVKFAILYRLCPSLTILLYFQPWA